MKSDSRRYLFDVPGTYRIRIQGQLDTRASCGFACMSGCTCRVSGNPPTTTLTGSLLDQAGLISMLTELYDMGFTLLDLKRLSDG